jgi:hypothetical protein
MQMALLIEFQIGEPPDTVALKTDLPLRYFSDMSLTHNFSGAFRISQISFPRSYTF